jgi:hypothetical protein
MSTELEKIQRKIAELKRDAEELQRLKLACDDLKKLRRSLVKTEFD